MGRIPGLEMVLQSAQRDLRFAGGGLQGRPRKAFFVQQLQRSVNQFALGVFYALGL